MGKGPRRWQPAQHPCNAVDLAIGERAAGPIFTASDGHRLDRHGAARIVGRVARRAGVVEPISPHTMRQRVHHRCP
jgi:site-specific recombinase XerD